MTLTFPNQLNQIRDGVLAQENTLLKVAKCFAESIARGGLVHVYANGHSRVAVEKLCVRMGALTGFHPLLCNALANFTDVVGADSLRMTQAIEKVEGLGAKSLTSLNSPPESRWLWCLPLGRHRRLWILPWSSIVDILTIRLIAIASLRQSREGAPKHSSGNTLYHIIQQARRGYLLDNCMPMGDVSIAVEGIEESYRVCPLSSIGALTIVSL